jgi:membrane protease YdiL (CAAX protease family)
VQTPEEFGARAAPYNAHEPSSTSNQQLPAPRIDPDDPPWGFGMAFLVLVGTLLFLLFAPLVFLLPYAAYRGISFSSPDATKGIAAFALNDPTALFLQVLATFPVHLLTFLLVWIVVTRFGKRPFWETLGWGWSGRFQLWTCVGIGVAMFFAGTGVAQLLGGDKPTQLDLILSSSPGAKYVIVVLATFTAPFAEEFIYRGLLYSSLQRAIGKVSAVLLVLGLFTLVHVPQYLPNYGVIAAVCLLSIVLTVVRAVSGRLLPCVVIHMVFNGIQSILILTGVSGSKPKITPDQVTGLVLPLLRALRPLI